MRKVIVIVGTNASGKSSLAIEIAKKFNGEVVSADSRQVYKGLDIGTGKVAAKEMKSIPHHLLDVAKPNNIYTAADFARDGQKVLQDILARGKVPIIAGGTGFYIDVLLNPNSVPTVPPNEKLRAELEEKTSEELFTQLQKVDSKRAKDLLSKNEQNHKRRIIRSIEIASSPVQNNSSLTQGIQGVALDTLWIGIQWDKEELKERIHQRTLKRIKDGMIDEAKELYKGGLSYKRMESLGLEYKLLAKYLQKQITEEELIELIDIGDTQYAKQQRTWFQRNKRINWIENNNLGKVDILVKNFFNR